MAKLNIRWTLAFLAAPALMAGPAMFTEVKTDAQEIHTSAVRLEKLASQTDVKWIQYDKQWNEIKPAQEALVLHLSALEAKETSMSAADRKALDATKAAIQDISARTHELRVLLDQPGVDLKSPKFERYAKDLAVDASHLNRT